MLLGFEDWKLIYSNRSVQVVVAAAAGFVPIIGQNGNRVSMLITSDGTAAANFTVELSTISSSPGIFVFTNPPLNFPMLYRDVGPLVREAVFARVAVGSITVSIVETSKVPSYRE